MSTSASSPRRLRLLGRSERIHEPEGMETLFDIIHEDADLLVINKPAGLVCHPTKGDSYSSLISRVRLFCGPAAETHLINRLDRETSGLVVVAKNFYFSATMISSFASQVLSVLELCQSVVTKLPVIFLGK